MIITENPIQQAVAPPIFSVIIIPWAVTLLFSMYYKDMILYFLDIYIDCKAIFYKI